MTQAASTLRRLDVSDFPPEQISGWVAASADGAGPAGESSPDDGKGSAAPKEWLVAYTNPRREDDVVRGVGRRGFQTFVPVMTVTRRRAAVTRPVFPRYLFVAVQGQAGDTSYGLRETPGLESVLRFDGQLVTVRGGLIEGLRAEQDAGVYDFTDARLRERAAVVAVEAEAKRAAVMQPGRKVRITAGAWRFFHGEIAEPPAKGHVWVAITLFGRRMPVPLPLASVELVT